MPSYFRVVLERSLSFMLLQASLKLQRPGYCWAKGRHPARDPQLDAIEFQSFFRRKPQFHVIVGIKGEFENSNQLEYKLSSFFYLPTLFNQFLTKQKCLERICLIFDYYQFIFYFVYHQYFRPLSMVMEKKRTGDLMEMLALKETVVQMAKANGVRQYRHVLRRDDGHVLRKALEFEVKGKRKRG